MIGDVHTSETLQQQFPDVYKDFFAKHDLVVSGHCGCSLLPTNVGVKSKLIRSKIKLPFKGYIGINFGSGNACVFKDIIVYKKSTFVQETFSDIYKNLDDLCVYIKEKNIGMSLEISYITEFSRGYGIGYTGTCTALIAYALHHIISDAEIDTYDMNNTLFRNMYIDSRNMLSVLKNNDTCGTASLNTLLPSIGPILFETEFFDPKSIKNNDFSRIDSDFELINKEEDELFPFVLIYSGVKSSSRYLNKSKKFERAEIEGDFEEYLDTRKEYGFESFPSTLADGYDLIADVVAYFSAIVMSRLKHIYTKGINKKNIYRYIQSVNKMNQLVSLLEPKDDFYEELTLWMQEKEMYRGYTLFPIYSGKLGGSYLMVFDDMSKKNVSEPMLSEFLQGFPGSHIYADSDMLPYGKSGIQIEQYLSKGIYGKMIKEGTMIYINNQGIKDFGTYDMLFKKYSDGFLLDEKSNKVYVNGNKLTKVEIKSQTTTVEVIGKLLKNMGEPVNNGLFLPSTYTRQQNQMLGKIIAPLRKLSDSYFGDIFPLQCTGTLRDFDMTLTSGSKIVIGIITSM